MVAMTSRIPPVCLICKSPWKQNGRNNICYLKQKQKLVDDVIHNKYKPAIDACGVLPVFTSTKVPVPMVHLISPISKQH